jgi:dTMP kinase
MFITLEGIEGSGKTTQIKRLIPVLQARGYDCLFTREPGATEIGRKIRAILLDGAHGAMIPLTELLLYEADRAQHVHEVIKPVLMANKIVVSDRFFDATTVYQGFGRGVDLERIQQIHELVLGDLKPDLTLVLDLPVRLGLERAWRRINSRSGGLPEDRFEKEAVAFHERVRHGYLTLAGEEPERFRVIDASGDEQSVHEKIAESVLPLISRHTRGLDSAGCNDS